MCFKPVYIVKLHMVNIHEKQLDCNLSLTLVKGQIVNIIGFVGHRVSVVTTQPCCWEETPRSSTYMNELG